MSRRKIKAEVLSLLSVEPVDVTIDILSKYQIQDLINPLFAAICRADSRIRWNGIHCFGYFLAKLADEEMEAARIIMRRFLWSLNDESGGIGWGAPETMAEAMIRHDGLRKEYLHMLVSYTQGDGPELCQDGNYLELPELQRGLLWALAKVAEKYPDDLRSFKFQDDLADYLNSSDAEVRFWAVKCLLLLGYDEGFSFIKQTGRDHTIEYYSDGVFGTSTIQDVLNQAGS